MFYDKSLHASQAVTLAFDLNAHACKLMLLVQWYRDRGERTLPVSYLKRLGFTRRQWELATKGTRKRDGRNIAEGHEGPARDGLEYTGMISEYRHYCDKTKRPVTHWVIGDVTKEVIEAIRAEREAEQFSVIEDDYPHKPDADEPVEPSVKVGTQTDAEAAYDAGYADGEAAGYDKGVRDLEVALNVDAPGCVKDAPLDNSSRDVCVTHVPFTAEQARILATEFIELTEQLEYAEHMQSDDLGF